MQFILFSLLLKLFCSNAVNTSNKYVARHRTTQLSRGESVNEIKNSIKREDLCLAGNADACFHTRDYA